jgi:hypothetical protein
MSSYAEDRERQRRGEILFKDKRVKDGWVLNMVKQNEDILSTSLYDASGKMLENKTFLTQVDDDIEKFREYVKLFEENPEQNYTKMSRITLIR